jgi:hypothetical protein
LDVVVSVVVVGTNVKKTLKAFGDAAQFGWAREGYSTGSQVLPI